MGAVQQRPGNVNAPPLAARQLLHRAAKQLLQLQQLRQFSQPLAEGLPRHAIQGSPALQVVPHRQDSIQD